MKARKKSCYELDNTLLTFNMCLMYWKKNFENENLQSFTKVSKRKKNQWYKKIKGLDSIACNLQYIRKNLLCIDWKVCQYRFATETMWIQETLFSVECLIQQMMK